MHADECTWHNSCMLIADFISVGTLLDIVEHIHEAGEEAYKRGGAFILGHV